jgi:chromosome segregation ATPase
MTVALAAALLGPARVRADDSIAVHRDAYLSLRRADVAKERGDWETALQTYELALRQFRALRDRAPSEMVEYRIAYCESQLANLAKEAETSTLGEAELHARRRGALQQENVYLRQQVSELEAELEQDLRLPGDEPPDWLALQRSARAAEKENRRLREQLDQAQGDRTALRDALEENRQLQERWAHQRERLKACTQMERQVDQLREEASALRTRNRQFELALKGAEREVDRLRASEERNRVLQAKVRLVQREWDACAADQQQYAARVRQLEAERDRLAKANQDREEALDAALSEAHTWMRQVSELTEQVSAAEQEAAEAQSDSASRRNDSLLQDEIQGLEDELAALRRRSRQAEARAALAQRYALQVAELEDQQVLLRQRLDESARKLTRLQAALMKQDPSAGDVQDHEAERQRSVDLEKDLFESLRAQGDLTRQLSQSEARSSEMQAKMAALQRELESLKPSIDELTEPVPR